MEYLKTGKKIWHLGKEVYKGLKTGAQAAVPGLKSAGNRLAGVAKETAQNPELQAFKEDMANAYKSAKPGLNHAAETILDATKQGRKATKEFLERNGFIEPLNNFGKSAKELGEVILEKGKEGAVLMLEKAQNVLKKS